MKNKLQYKILLITDVFDNNKFGGAEIYFYNLIKNLKKKKDFALHLICRSDNKRFIKGLNINHSLIPISRHLYLSLLYILISMVSFNLLVIFKKFNIILINHPLSALYTLFIPDRKKVIIFHSPWCFEYKYRWNLEVKISSAVCRVCSFEHYNQKSKLLGFYIRFLIEKLVYRKAVHIITLGNYTKKLCAKLFNTNATFYVIPPSIDIEEFDICSSKKLLREKLKIPQDKTVFFTARSLIPRTGIDILIKSLTLIRSRIEDCIVLIAGTGDCLDYYKNLVIKSGLQKYVKFLGFLDRKTLLEHFYAADCFLLPSWKLEGFGLVLLEALYSNLPVIATPVGAIPENLKDIPGCFISKNKTAESFAEQILNFLEKLADFENINIKKYYLDRYHNTDIIVEKIIAISRRYFR